MDLGFAPTWEVSKTLQRLAKRGRRGRKRPS
jgi:hypothetical protein